MVNLFSQNINKLLYINFVTNEFDRNINLMYNFSLCNGLILFSSSIHVSH